MKRRNEQEDNYHTCSGKKENPNNAGSKAREDLEKILICYGFQLKEIPLYRYQEMKHCRWKFVYKKYVHLLNFGAFL